MNKTFNNVCNERYYRGYEVQVDAYNGLYCYEILLDDIIDRLLAYAHNKSKVYVMRFDLRFPEGYCAGVKAENRIVSAFFNQLKTYLMYKTKDRTRRYPYRNHKDVAYMWVREVEKAKHAHYHCWLAVDGQKIHSPGLASLQIGIMGVAEKIWRRVSKGGSLWQSVGGKHLPRMLLVDVTTRQYKNPDYFAGVIYGLSYMAKCRSKFTRGAVTYQHVYGGSRYTAPSRFRDLPLPVVRRFGMRLPVSFPAKGGIPWLMKSDVNSSLSLQSYFQ